MKVIIIGGSAGGASLAARLRRLDENAEIIMLERGPYISYANCGLPYYVGDVIKEESSLLVMTEEKMESQFNIDIRCKTEAMAIDKDKKVVTITDHSTGEMYEESYDKLVLATGSSPLRPNIPGIGSEKIHTLWTVPDAVQLKKMAGKAKSAVVIGGGFIGLEIAENLLERGLQVTIADAADQILAPMDKEMAKILEGQVRSEVAKLILSDGVKAFEEIGGQVKVSLQSGQNLLADLVVLSIGVRPNTAIAKAAGLSMSERGFIEVDPHMKTSDEDIYAVGDIARYDDIVLGSRTTLQLAGPANREARIAADNIAGIPSVFRGTQGSSVARIFHLTAASTGANEKTLAKNGLVKGKDYETLYINPNNHPGYYPGAEAMMLKLIFAKDGQKIYGAQVIGGEGTEKRLDVLATVIRMGGSIYDLEELELSYSPVYSSPKDPVNMAGFVARNILENRVAFSDLYVFPENAELLDVREDVERMAYEIPGAIPMPLGTVRDQYTKLSADRPVVIFCGVGIRAYNAARILMQKGFKEVLVYPGGSKFYRLLHGEVENPKGDMSTVNPTIHTQKEAETMDKKIQHITENSAKTIELDCSGLQCPGPLMKVYETMKTMQDGEKLKVCATDPGFTRDMEGWCQRTGNTLLTTSKENGKYAALLRKGILDPEKEPIVSADTADGKTIIVFSGDYDKVMASFIIANGAAAMGRKVTMFFTFWGLTALRRPEKVKVKKTFMESMFGFMLPRGVGKLGLSRMNMGGMGTTMMKKIMKDKNVTPLEELIQKARENNVRLQACSMSMDVMGIHKEELIDGVEIVGVGSYLASAEEANVNLFL